MCFKGVMYVNDYNILKIKITPIINLLNANKHLKFKKCFLKKNPTFKYSSMFKKSLICFLNITFKRVCLMYVKFYFALEVKKG